MKTVEKMILFILIYLALWGCTSYMCPAYAQTDTKTEEVVEVQKDTPKYQEVIDYASEKISSAVDGIAEALEVPAEYVFTALVKRHYYRGIGHFIIAIPSALLFIMGYKAYRGAHVRMDRLVSKDNYYKPVFRDSEAATFVVSLIAGLVCSIYFFVELNTAVQRILVPEYFAIQEILEIFK